ncbi:hypothetical protein ACIQHV_32040 [Bacillus bombysepticus]|uniref:Uncharacterized protein n=1 Tax=Bacillus thuringiensis serovar kumamotoensis TaxID=132267 RepID=A0A9X6JQK6_BACUK|nr:hypothetical protein [Bacillus thuringiensis]MEC2873259.1 hypothetical protein [Bacillus cereus]OTZ74151.1 hypothetical protein BK769_13570 [Bacillus thuringiensis serovar kumamtoensis]
MDEELNYLAECFIDCQIATEKIIGSEYSDFIALANLSKELAFFNRFTNVEVINLWRNYRINKYIQKKYRLNPHYYKGFKEIVGLNNIYLCKKDQGIFCTFQFGDFNLIECQLYKILKSNVFSTENKYLDFSDLQTIKKDEIYPGLLFLDNLLYHRISTEDNDKTFLNLTFKSDAIDLLCSLKRPLCLLIADRNRNGESRLTAYNLFRSIYVGENKKQKLFTSILEPFNLKLRLYPHLWGLWDKLYTYEARNEENLKFTELGVDWFDSDKNLGLNIKTGNILNLVEDTKPSLKVLELV